MTREIWRKKWLSSINELTSLDLQRKSWLEGTNRNPHWSFVEFMSCYFDDLVIEHDYLYPFDKGWVTKEEFEIIKQWHEALNEYSSPNKDDYNNKAILNDPRWLDIIKMGQTVKAQLIKILTSDEIQILTAEKNVA